MKATARGSSLGSDIIGTNVSREPSVTLAATSKLAQPKTAREPELPCFVCQKMRKGNPNRHRLLVSAGEIRNCLLCSRDFCEMHVSKSWAVCEIDHGTYYRNHRHLPGVYSSLAARNLALGVQESRNAEEGLD